MAKKSPRSDQDQDSLRADIVHVVNVMLKNKTEGLGSSHAQMKLYSQFKKMIGCLDPPHYDPNQEET